MANTAGAPDPSQPQEKEERGRSQLPERQGRQKGRKGGRQGARQGGREGREIAIARCEVNAAASACERSSAWQRALLLLYGGRLLAGRGFKPDSGLDGSFYSAYSPAPKLGACFPRSLSCKYNQYSGRIRTRKPPQPHPPNRPEASARPQDALTSPPTVWRQRVPTLPPPLCERPQSPKASRRSPVTARS